MRFLYFDVRSRALGTCGRKLLLTATTAFAAMSCVGTAHAQTPITVTVGSTARQTLKAIGASEPLSNADVLNDTNHQFRDQMMDLTFGDLKMKVVRLWAHIGPGTNYSGNVVDPLDAQHKDATVANFRDTYINSGFVDAAKSRGVTTLLLGPTYDTYQTTLQPDAYAQRIFWFINTISQPDAQGRPGIKINATGLVNEPSGAEWTPAMILQGVSTLKSILPSDVAIIAPENASCDWTAYHNVQALQGDTPTWSKLSGIATHSYAMAAKDKVGDLITSANGSPTKDWWMTEAGKVNQYGNDDVSYYEPPSGTAAVQGAAYLGARFLTDMNHMVTHWVWFVGYGVKPLSDSNNNPDDSNHDKDGGQKLVYPTFDAQLHPQGVGMRPKYWYFKQLRDAFPDGTVFRRSDSPSDMGTGSDSTDTMVYSFNERAHVYVAAGKTPDGSWHVGVQNLTPVTTADGSVNYSASSYAVTLKINELSGSGSKQFAVIRSNGTSAATVTDIATATNGQITVTVGPQELVTLGPPVVVDSIHFYPRSGYATRMTGGVFQGSNGDKVTGPWTTLATINSTPADNAWATLPSSNTLGYHYLRYLSPNGSYGNVGEVKFYSNGVQIMGYPYGTLGSGSAAYNNTFVQVYDQDHTTYFDTGIANGSYAGLDMFTTPGSGNGVQGQYFSDPNFQTLVTTRTDPVISFDWTTTAPMTSVGPDNFSVRWTGHVQGVESGDYTFRLVADDGAALYLNGSATATVSGSGTPFQWTATSPVTLAAGQQVTLKYDYHENSGNAHAQLQWKRPGQTNYEIVPKSQLYVP